MKIIRAVLYVLANLIVNSIIEGLSVLVAVLCTRLNFFFGIILMFALFGIVLGTAELIYFCIARISLSEKVVMITSFIIQGGTALIGIVVIWIYVFSQGIGIGTLISGVTVTLLTGAICKCSIKGSMKGASII
jgi:hypothetical protein